MRSWLLAVLLAVAIGVLAVTQTAVVLFPRQAVTLQGPIPRPDKSHNKSDYKAHATQQRGSNNAVPGAAAPGNGANNNQTDAEQRSPPDWWLAIFTAGLVIVGILQLFVFGRQAGQLRRSVDLTRDIARHQERDMRASIDEASRSAAAMERVAAGIADSVANTRALMDTQREFWQRQMRAYVFLQTADIFNVADPPTPLKEGDQAPGAITLPDRGPLSF